jgi:thiamine biosynthesis lipoprotein
MKREVYRFTLFTSPAEVVIFDQKKSLSDSLAEKIYREGLRLYKKFNFYDDNSTLSKINRREVKKLDRESRTVLKDAVKLYRETNGVFNIAIGSLSPCRKKETLAEYRECINRLESAVESRFKLSKDSIFFENSETLLDLGGYIKEYALDRATSILKKGGVKSALLNFGGDLSAIGKKPDGNLFSIGIKNPENPTQNITEIAVEDSFITTSAHYERGFNIGEERISHIESRGELLSVTAIGNSGVESGVWSTSLLIDSTLQKPKNIDVFRIDKTACFRNSK